MTRPIAHRSAAAALTLALAAGATLAQPAARAKAQQACAVCHGSNGVSTAPDAPNLAGQPELYIAAQLRAFRSGARPHEVMKVIAQGLSDDDIVALSRWYSSIKVEARVPD